MDAGAVVDSGALGAVGSLAVVHGGIEGVQAGRALNCPYR